MCVCVYTDVTSQWMGNASWENIGKQCVKQNQERFLNKIKVTNNSSKRLKSFLVKTLNKLVINWKPESNLSLRTIIQQL